MDSCDCPRSFNQFFKLSQASFSASPRQLLKFSSSMSFLIFGPTNTLCLIFTSRTPGYFLHKYVKPSPSRGKAFTNYFITPSLIRSGGSKTFFGSTKLSRQMFLWSWCKWSSTRPTFLSPMQIPRSAVPLTQKTWEFRVPCLLPQQFTYNLQITTDHSVVIFVIYPV